MIKNMRVRSREEILEINKKTDSNRVFWNDNHMSKYCGKTLSMRSMKTFSDNMVWIYVDPMSRNDWTFDERWVKEVIYELESELFEL